VDKVLLSGMYFLNSQFSNKTPQITNLKMGREPEEGFSKEDVTRAT
jgi:hypothetical protein